MKNQTKALIMGGFVVLFWTTVATAFKIALADMSYIMLLLIASLTALLVSFGEIIRSGKLKEIAIFFKNGSSVLKGAMQGFLNPFLYYLILFKAYSLLPAQIAQPLNYSWQVVLIIMMALFFKQRLKWLQLVGVLVSFAGIIMLSANNAASADGKL